MKKVKSISVFGLFVKILCGISLGMGVLILKIKSLLNFNVLIAIGVWGSMSIVLSIMTSIVLLIRIKIKGEQEFLKLFYEKFPNKLGLMLLVITLILCIKTEVKYSKEEIKDLINLQWNIFGISCALFLVWGTVVTKHLKDNSPKSQERKLEETVADRINRNKKNRLFCLSVKSKTVSIHFLLWHLVCLVAETVCYYTVPTAINVMMENIAISGLLIGILAVSILCIDISIVMASDNFDLIERDDMKERDLAQMYMEEKEYMYYKRQLKKSLRIANMNDEEMQKEIKAFENMSYQDFIKYTSKDI